MNNALNVMRYINLRYLLTLRRSRPDLRPTIPFHLSFPTIRGIIPQFFVNRAYAVSVTDRIMNRVDVGFRLGLRVFF